MRICFAELYNEAKKRVGDCQERIQDLVTNLRFAEDDAATIAGEMMRLQGPYAQCHKCGEFTANVNERAITRPTRDRCLSTWTWPR